MFSWATILGFLSGIMKVVSQILEFAKIKQAVEQGKVIEQGEIAKKELELDKAQDEILMREQTKDETVKQLETGKF